MASGLAKQGMLPVFAVYDSFLQRGYDMLAQDVSLDKLHVVFAVDRTGLVGADGETHHGCIDYLSQIPDMTVLCPASFAELRSMLRTALYRCGGPVAVRYPRGGEGTYRDNCGDAPVSVLRQGADVSIVTYGILTEQALAAAELLAQEHIAAQVVKLNRVTPLDGDAVCGALAGVRRLVVLEDQLRRDTAARRTCVADAPGPDTRPARLSYRVLGEEDGRALVLIRLETGRTHQIRAQFSSRGLPLCGDAKYGAAPPGPLGLWSYRIAFCHPQTGRPLQFSHLPPAEDPWLPFQTALSQLQGGPHGQNERT